MPVGLLHRQGGSGCSDLYWHNRDCHHMFPKLWSLQLISWALAFVFTWAVSSECLLCLCWTMVKYNIEKFVFLGENCVWKKFCELCVCIFYWPCTYLWHSLFITICEEHFWICLSTVTWHNKTVTRVCGGELCTSVHCRKFSWVLWLFLMNE